MTVERVEAKKIVECPACEKHSMLLKMSFNMELKPGGRSATREIETSNVFTSCACWKCGYSQTLDLR